jgi:hypothetical protein
MWPHFIYCTCMMYVPISSISSVMAYYLTLRDMVDLFIIPWYSQSVNFYWNGDLDYKG